MSKVCLSLLIGSFLAGAVYWVTTYYTATSKADDSWSPAGGVIEPEEWLVSGGGGYSGWSPGVRGYPGWLPGAYRKPVSSTTTPEPTERLPETTKKPKPPKVKLPPKLPTKKPDFPTWFLIPYSPYENTSSTSSESSEGQPLYYEDDYYDVKNDTTTRMPVTSSEFEVDKVVVHVPGQIATPPPGGPTKFRPPPTTVAVTTTTKQPVKENTTKRGGLWHPKDENEEDYEEHPRNVFNTRKPDKLLIEGWGYDYDNEG